MRSGGYFPPLLELHRPAENPLAAVVQAASVQGILTRSVDDQRQAIGRSGLSKCQVSGLCEESDERVQSFLNRNRAVEGDWSFIWIDATNLKSPFIHNILNLKVGWRGCVGVG